MVEKSKKPNLLKNSMQGAKNRFDERLEKAQNIAILSGEEGREEANISTPEKVVKPTPSKQATKTKTSTSAPAAKKVVVEKKPKTLPQKIPTQLDSFKFPVSEHVHIQDLIIDYAKRGEIVNKSEIIRLGLAMLKKATVPERLNALDNLQRVRVGRPPGS